MRRVLLPVGVLLALLLVAGGAVLVLRARPDPLLAEYPDAPFAPVAADFPRIISAGEAPPREQKEAYARYQEQREAARKFLFETGAIAKENADAREAVKLAADDQFVRARELALKALKDDPDSVAARFALAAVEEEAEQNLPRALFLLRKLRKQLHQRGAANPDDADAREWYLRVLEREFNLLRTMGRDEECLRALDLVEQVYQPLPDRRVWPLMRLKRFDEARTALDRTAEAGAFRLRVLNSRMVLESQAHRRTEAYEAGKEAVTLKTDSAVLWRNFAEMCDDNFRFDEAEQALVKAANCRRVDYYGSPYTGLAAVYAGRNRPADAWDALRRAQDQRRRREPHTLVSDQDQFNQTAALFLARLGRTRDALRFARQTVERPGRGGMHSDDERDRRLTNARLLYALVAARLEELTEEGGSTTERAALELEQLSLGRQLLKELAGDDYLVKLMRPYLPGVPATNPGALIDVLPTGVAAEALRRAREQEDHPGAAPYFDAADAALAWKRGRLEETRDAAKKALDGLDPEYEKDLRADAAVIAGEASRRLGDKPAMRAYFDQALRDCPVAFRNRGLAIPVKVSDDGSEPAARTAKRVLASPRFREDPDGFALTLRAVNGRLTFRLDRADGRHCEGEVPLGEDVEAVAAAGCAKLHERVMSPALDLTPTDVNSLEAVLFAAPTSSDSGRLLGLAGRRE